MGGGGENPNRVSGTNATIEITFTPDIGDCIVWNKFSSIVFFFFSNRFLFQWLRLLDIVF